MGDQPEKERYEWEAVQDHYGVDRWDGLRIFQRNLRRPHPRGEQHRHEMRRMALVFLGIGVALVVVIALAQALI